MKINGKANSITVDNCRDFGFVFDSVISQVEILNCTKVQGQMDQNCPSISIDGSRFEIPQLTVETLNTQVA